MHDVPHSTVFTNTSCMIINEVFRSLSGSFVPSSISHTCQLSSESLNLLGWVL